MSEAILGVYEGPNNMGINFTQFLTLKTNTGLINHFEYFGKTSEAIRGQQRPYLELMTNLMIWVSISLSF